MWYIQASYRGASAENNTASIADSGRPDVGVGGEANVMGTADGGGWSIHSLSREDRNLLLCGLEPKLSQPISEQISLRMRGGGGITYVSSLGALEAGVIPNINAVGRSTRGQQAGKNGDGELHLLIF